MKIFILCGGFGSRLDNEGRLKAKPMIRIGNKPILMHLIETFINQGFHDFVICTGHKSETITKHFLNQKKQTIIISKEKNVLNIKYKYKNSNLNNKKYQYQLTFSQFYILYTTTFHLSN